MPPERLYLKPSEWDHLLEGHSVGQFTSFDAAPDTPNAIDLGGRRHEGFAQARTAQGVNLFDKVSEHVAAANAAGRRVVIAAFTEGSAARLAHLLQEHGATTPVPVADYAIVQGLPAGVVGIAVLAARARLRARWPGGRSARRTSSATACRARRASAGRRSASSPKRRRSATATWWCIASMASAATTAW